jgi:deoxyribodipyrimidine photo-lyase
VTTSILWFRRDLRLRDHPALLVAGSDVVPVFVLDDVLLSTSGANRRAFLFRALRSLDDDLGGALRVVAGPPEIALPLLVKASGASSVHISSDHGPYGRARDSRVAEALGEVPLIATGSPYGVTPGSLTTGGGTPYKVFTPFARAWRERGIHSPATGPVPRWTDGGVASVGVPADPDAADLPEASEAAALARWAEFRDKDLEDYAEGRNTAEHTSRVSPYLKYGLLHPRTLHAELGGSDSERTFATELIWRDFYADVLWHRPDSARADLNLQGLEYDEPGPLLEAWAKGRTGYPIVDAAMRQLLAEGWMPNRLRMVTASFLTKDLHVWWRHGARHLMEHLVDGDLASNQHGWQWTAGTGTDPSPYFRVFNPVTQGRAFDPSGAYIRQWVPELRDASDPHQPVDPIVDHATERLESLDRYQRARAGA